ncbi:MAG TPA: hypothetical protein VHE99_03185 [Gammaproteobacteria bacterium]|nr:hypothetical protein [Gammaproteobacteria bacterium]
MESSSEIPDIKQQINQIANNHSNIPNFSGPLGKILGLLYFTGFSASFGWIDTMFK